MVKLDELIVEYTIVTEQKSPPDEGNPVTHRRTAAVASATVGAPPITRPVPPSGPRSPPRPSSTSILAPDQVFPNPAGGSERKKADTQAPLEFSENQQIGRFELIREIARGGMGQVFLARDTKLGRKVAIKFLLRPDPTFVSRFVIEARATARCTHENIVTIFEVDEHDGLPFMVLEYLEGKTLNEAFETRPAPRQFAELMVSVARALERAHEHGIVHRDLKPSNIFITDRGVVKVLDFGVAKCFDNPVDAFDHVITATASGTRVPRALSASSDTFASEYVTFSGGGTMVGTQPYMSPEQWGADEVDQASDIWAFGIMFWRALAKKHPAGSMAPDKLRARLCDLEAPLPSILAGDPTLPSDLGAIVDRCLSKRKADRPTATDLVAELQAFLQPKARISDDACPYRGLAAFGERDAKYFFGRSSEIRTAIQQLDVWPLLAVIGPSGVGKSSFVHAGLAPAIRDAGGNWQIRVLRPGRNPLQSLASVVDDVLESNGQGVEMVVAQLRDAPGLFGDMLRKAAKRRKHEVMIIVDQLEELFTLSDDGEVRALFLAALLAAADDPSAPVRIVLSMRADFLDHLADHKQFMVELTRGMFFLSAPGRDNLRETLVRPAELAGYAFENQEIVEDMLQSATSRGALPLLQFAATQLWDARDRTRKRLTAAAYAAMGGVGGAFARHADEVAAAVPKHSQLLLKAIMTRLVTPEGTRDVVDQRELAGLTEDQSEVARILDQLVRARLIHVHSDDDQGATVEIVHEVLISEWPMLGRWLEEGHALRGFMQELGQAVRQWVARGKASDLVWRGATAQEALALTKRHVLDLSAAEREFLLEAELHAARGRRRKMLVFASIFSVLGLVIAGGAIAVVRISNAQEATNQQAIAAQSEAKKARSAEADAARQLDAFKAEEQRRATAEFGRKQAEAAATTANLAVDASREELQQANLDLQRTLKESQHDKDQAQALAVAAKAAAEIARKATDEAKSANAKLQTLLAQQKDRVKQLELEKKKIATGL